MRVRKSANLTSTRVRAHMYTVAASGLVIGGGAFKGQHIFLGSKIEFHEISPLPLPNFLTPWNLFPYKPKRIFFSGNFKFYPRPFKIVQAYQNFSRTHQNFFGFKIL